MKNQTTEELQRENADLRELLRKTRDQLTIALDEVARNHAAKMINKPMTQTDGHAVNLGEWHHRAFEQLCPIPVLSEITTFK